MSTFSNRVMMFGIDFTGRRLAYRSSVLRSRTLIDEKPVPIGVVTGPLSATLLRRIDSRTSGGRGSPKRERASEPTKYFSHSTWTPAHSMMETTEAVTSGPMPSPGSSVILWFAMQQSFHALARRVEGEIERKVAAQLLVIAQLVDGPPDPLQRRLHELEVVQPPANDGHL